MNIDEEIKLLKELINREVLSITLTPIDIPLITDYRNRIQYLEKLKLESITNK